VNRFVWPVRVYYEDTDSAGVVYYANYLKFMERARTEWLRDLGYEQDVLAREAKLQFVVRAVQLDYWRPARFNDLLQVVSRISVAKRASLIFAQTIARTRQPDVPLCSGLIRVACVHTESLKPQPLPPLPLLDEVFGDH
jgi:acyl-CoA thioester hydrolase